MSNKLRIKILNLFTDQVSRTNKQISDELGLKPTRTHYHIRELERVGLIKVVETKQIGGIVEKYFLPIAPTLRIAKDSNRERVIVSLSNEFFDAYKKIESEKKAIERFNILNLNENEKEEFVNEINEVYQKWEERCGNKHKPDGSLWRFVQLLYQGR